jgi:hypothetical protein
VNSGDIYVHFLVLTAMISSHGDINAYIPTYVSWFFESFDPFRAIWQAASGLPCTVLSRFSFLFGTNKPPIFDCFGNPRFNGGYKIVEECSNLLAYICVIREIDFHAFTPRILGRTIGFPSLPRFGVFSFNTVDFCSCSHNDNPFSYSFAQLLGTLRITFAPAASNRLTPSQFISMVERTLTRDTQASQLPLNEWLKLNSIVDFAQEFFLSKQLPFQLHEMPIWAVHVLDSASLDPSFLVQYPWINSYLIFPFYSTYIHNSGNTGALLFDVFLLYPVVQNDPQFQPRLYLVRRNSDLSNQLAQDFELFQLPFDKKKSFRIVSDKLGFDLTLLRQETKATIERKLDINGCLYFNLDGDLDTDISF